MRNPIARVIRGIRPHVVEDKREWVQSRIHESDMKRARSVEIIKSGFKVDCSDDEFVDAVNLLDIIKMANSGITEL